MYCYCIASFYGDLLLYSKRMGSFVCQIVVVYRIKFQVAGQFIGLVPCAITSIKASNGMKERGVTLVIAFVFLFLKRDVLFHIGINRFYLLNYIFAPLYSH